MNYLINYYTLTNQKLIFMLSVRGVNLLQRVSGVEILPEDKIWNFGLIFS